MKHLKNIFVLVLVIVAFASCNQKNTLSDAPKVDDNFFKTGPYCGDMYYDLCDGENTIAVVNVYSSPNNIYVYFTTSNPATDKISQIFGTINGTAFVHNYNESPTNYGSPKSTNWTFVKLTDLGMTCGNTYTLSLSAVINGTTYTICGGEEIEYSLECCCWSDETAWSAGNRYVNRGNWATFTSYAGVAKTVNLIAGQKTVIGTVSFSAPSGGKVTITVDLDGKYAFADVAENIKIQDYATPPSGNPSPGQFEWKFNAAGTAPYPVEVDQNNYYGVHVDALVGVVCEEE